MPVVRALVVYEAVCVGTQEVVSAIAAQLVARGAVVDTVAAADAPPLLDRPVDLLVVAAPTNPRSSQKVAAFIPIVGLPTQPTRADPTLHRDGTGGPGCGAPGLGGAGGIREWIERVRLPRGQPTATFDIRMRPWPPGSAARAAARRLRERGATIIGTASFEVLTPDGPIVDGESGHLRDWAAGVVVDAAIHRVG